MPGNKDKMKIIGRNLLGLYCCIPTRKPENEADALYLGCIADFHYLMNFSVFSENYACLYIDPPKEWF